MRTFNLLTFIILSIIGFLFQGCDSGLPKIKHGDFYVKSSLENKVVAGEEITLYYYIREGEDVDCFYITITKSSEINEEQFCPITHSSDSIVSLKLLVPENCINLRALVVSNYNCKTEGYASADFLTYVKNGKLSENSTGFLIGQYYDNNDTLKADSLIKKTLLKNPQNLMVFQKYWYWLRYNDRHSKLQSEIDKIKSYQTNKMDEKYAILCVGYYGLGQIDSMEAYLEKYIASTDNPIYASELKYNLYYLYDSNNKEFKNYGRFNRLIAQKCPLSKAADFFLEEIISKEIKDTLAEKIIINKLNDSKEALYYKALYALQVLKDTVKSRNAAINYVDFNKKSYFPKIEISNQVNYIERTPKVFSLLSEISISAQESYNYILKAIEFNRNSEELASLHSKAALSAFKLNDKIKTEFHLKQICKQGKLLVAQKTLNEIYPNTNNAGKLSEIFKSAASLCDSVPDLTFVIDESTKISTTDNRILFINLWSPTCSPCIKEISTLNKLRRDFSRENIKWLARDFEKDYKEYTDKLPEKFIGWSMYQRSEEVNKVFFRQSAIPQTYIVDKNKKIRYHSIGLYDYTNDEEKLILEMLIKEK